MASSSLSPTTPYAYNWMMYPVLRTSIIQFPSHFIIFPSSINHTVSSPIHRRRSFSLHPYRSVLRSSPDPPPGKEPLGITGIGATFSRIWDRVKIFFAVLFWMSLFFWASASDGKNTRGRNERDRFRK